MKVFSKPMKHIGSILTAAVLLAAGSIPIARAALPTPIAPSTAPAAGNWLELIKGYIKDGGLVLGLAIAVIAFLWISYITISKFNEARMGKAEWGEVGLTGVAAASVMVFISYLLTEASTTI